jgi:hypothetical protein
VGVTEDSFLRRPASGLHRMQRHDVECLETIASEKQLSEPCEAALRAAGCGKLADDWRLCLTLLWIAAVDVTSFEGLNHSMGGTLGIASGAIRSFVNGLRVDSYLAVGPDYGRIDYGIALTAEGRLAAEVLRTTRRAN